ncbi:hypothetical protein H4219_002175 [Mycoemilia scoparia]|uniref:Mitochondrial import inner membrane translocase subunit TIM50 n=1 Tax=Mycoemilia scoparia TaxID=417184 RepID=A0A9W8A7L5_9FUNG|nr:hypothetical protein H4219_002175 [Mycoemilia scoparia]
MDSSSSPSSQNSHSPYNKPYRKSINYSRSNKIAGEQANKHFRDVDFLRNIEYYKDRPLLVFDLNGTLVQRNGLDEFLEFAFDNFAVMVWSSAQPASVHNMITKAFGKHGRKLVRMWDRRHCDLNGEYFGKSQSIKNLNKLFTMWTLKDSKNKRYAPELFTKELDDPEEAERTEALAKLFSETWSIKDVILVDDSESKAVENLGNHINIEPFNDAGDVSENELARLKTYLESFLVWRSESINSTDPSEAGEPNTDVRNFLKTYNWDLWQRQSN